MVTAEDIQRSLDESNASIHFKEVASHTHRTEWRKQGLKMFRNRFYEQAMKCFE